MEPFGHAEAVRMRGQEVSRRASAPDRLMQHELRLSRAASRSPAVERPCPRIRSRRRIWLLRPAPCC